MKRTLAFSGIALALASVSRADFTPIPLAPGSFNHDVVVENTAPPPLSMAVTATMDQGTNNAGNTWYEIGYNTNAAALDTGLPAAGSRVTNSAGNHVYMMPPDYTTNNAIVVGHHSGTGSPIIQYGGRLTLTTPAAYGFLSFLNAAGNGPAPVGYVINYADSSSESNTFNSLDWFNQDGAVYTNRGRINIGNGAFDVRNPGDRAAQLYGNDVILNNPSVNITSIDFYYAGVLWQNGRANIFGVSGSTDNGVTYSPIPVSGFTYDTVMEAGGPRNVPLPAGTVTATMDGGTNLANYTWHEQGYFARFPSSGLPAPGSTLTSVTLTTAQYQLPASYTANNAAMLDSSNTTANLTFSTPAAYGGLSFLVSGANGDTTLPCVLEFQDGTTETNAIFVSDWFNTTRPYSYRAFGRVRPNDRSVDQTPDRPVNPPIDSRTIINPLPRLFDAAIAVNNTASAITNLMLVRTNVGGNQRVAIFAVSGAPAGSIQPVLGAQPAGFKNWEGSNVVLSVTVPVGTAPLAYQWKRAPKGGGVNNIFDPATFVNVADGGNISGATTSTLTISGATVANSGDYRVIVSNPYGAVTSSVATVTMLSTNASIVLTTDPITAFGQTGSPAAQSVANAINRVVGNNDPARWQSFGVNNQVLPWTGPVGFVVTPSQGESIITSLRFYTANDNQSRDPADYTLEGSNDDGVNWTPITGGVLLGTGAIPTGRNNQNPNQALNPVGQQVQEVDFANSTGYNSYRLTITNNYQPNVAALMQMGEVELLGALVPNPPVWTRQPVPNVRVFAGASPTFGVSTLGYPLPRYQWYTNEIAVPGATNATYTFANAQLADSGRTFRCTATNIFGLTNSTSATLTVISPPTEPYPVAVLADNPIAYWRLNEGPDDMAGNNGVLANDYRGGHSGHYSNAVIQATGYNPTADADKAAQFGTTFPTDSRVAEIHDLSFAASNATVNFSVEAWINGPGQTIAGAGIITKGTGGGGEQFNLDCGGGGNGLRFFYRDAAGAARLATSSRALDGNWHHVVGVCDQANGVVSLYVDGAQVATGSAPAGGGALNTPSPVSIGARQTGAATGFGLQYSGTVDEVAIYNYALSSSQVLNHFFAAQYPPVFTYGPTNTTVNEGATAIFYSSAYGPGTLAYQWYEVTAGDPGVPVAGQTSSNLVLTGVTSAMSGRLYRVVASNQYGSVTNPSPVFAGGAQLTVNSGPPSIVVDLPASSVVYAGRTLDLSVTVAGTEPISYQWQRDGVNLSNGGRINGAQSNRLTIANAQSSDTGDFQVSASSPSGGPVSSALSAVFVQSVPQLNTNGAGWGLNGATISGNVLNLTFDPAGETRSAFYIHPMYIGAFEAGFTYQESPGAGAADGMAFVLHNDPRGTTALGGGGGSLGYSGITPSFAILFNIYAPNTIGIAFSVNGAIPAVGGYTVTTPLNIASGNPINTTIRYTQGTLQLALTDAVAATSFATNLAVNLPAALGGSTALVGFTAADGGVQSTQTVTNFTFIPLPVLSVQNTGTNTALLTWPASIGGYVVQSNASLGGGTWQDIPTSVNGQLVVPVSASSSYFRLHLLP